MKTKSGLSCFGGSFKTPIFDENSLFNTLLGFRSYCDYKPTKAGHANSRGEHTSEIFTTLNISGQSHLNCCCFNGGVVNGWGKPKLFSFVLDKSSCC